MGASARDALAQLELLASQNKNTQAKDKPRAASAREAIAELRLTAPRGAARPQASMPATSMDEHRLRMRQKLRRAGPEALADHELLEMVLFGPLPRRDTKPIAYRLLARFGSFANVISAREADIEEVDGMGEVSASYLKVVQAAAHRLARA
jgi:DNA repair protein RadC